MRHDQLAGLLQFMRVAVVEAVVVNSVRVGVLTGRVVSVPSIRRPFCSPAQSNSFQVPAHLLVFFVIDPLSLVCTVRLCNRWDRMRLDNVPSVTTTRQI